MKKKAVVDAAKKLFGEKGYDAVVMDEIARESGVSKGTIYKHFSSKEELLIEISSEILENIKKRFAQISLNEELGPKEKIVEMIYTEVQEIFKNQKLAFMLITEMFIEDESEAYKVYRKIGLQIADWMKVILVPFYGKEVETYIWEILLMIFGIMRQYLDLIIKGNLKLDERFFSQYLANIADSIVLRLLEQGHEPLITPEMLNIDRGNTQGGAGNNVVKIGEVLQDIESRIKTIPKERQANQGLMDAFQHLKRELIENKDYGKEYLVKALLNYLKNEQSLNALCCRLEELILAI